LALQLGAWCPQSTKQQSTKQQSTKQQSTKQQQTVSSFQFGTWMDEELRRIVSNLIFKCFVQNSVQKRRICRAKFENQRPLGLPVPSCPLFENE
jgi:4-hydroxy-3-methylbut-2-enyl diphosphate reductase IspH